MPLGTSRPNPVIVDLTFAGLGKILANLLRTQYVCHGHQLQLTS